MEENPQSKQAEEAADGGPGYEVRDSAAGPIYRFAAGLVVLIAGALFVTAVAFSLLTEREAARDTEPPPVVPAEEEPPAPLLQAAPVSDLAKLRERERQTLNSYGWVDEERGLVRIPIGRAVELVAGGMRPPVGAPEDEAAQAEGR